MSKRMFWQIFHKAWQASFTSKNIKKAFEKTGIWPRNSQKTVALLQKPEPQPATPSRLPTLSIKTPLSCHGLRQLLRTSPTSQKYEILARAAMRLATHHGIQIHENNGLRRAIFEERKHRQRSKRLNLVGEESAPEPQFFSPTKVLQAKAFQETKEAQEQEEIRQKALRKEEAAQRRQQALAQKQEAALQRQMRQAAAKEAKEAEKAEKAAQREAKRVEREHAKEAKALAAAERKKQQEMRKTAAAAAAAAEKSSEAGPAAPSGRRKKAPNPLKKLVAQTSEPPNSPPAIEQAGTSAGPAEVTVATDAPPRHSRRGRALALPQRFLD